MAVLIIWASMIVIVLLNVKSAKKMQQERVQEHQRNMQEHNQNVQQEQNSDSTDKALNQGSLSHGVNFSKEAGNDVSDTQAEPYKVNSFGGKPTAAPPVQPYTGRQNMTSEETEKLKQQIRERNNFQGKTFDKAEFHSPVMEAGSTGTYSDMTGGHTFTHYDCGHEYNDEIDPESQTTGKSIRDELKFDRNEMRKAFVMQEILKRKVV